MRIPPLPGALALFALALVVAACTGSDGAPETKVTASLAATEAELPPENEVRLKVYFRSGRGPRAHLVPVTRQEHITEDLPRRALDLLLAGPTADDGRAVHAVFPPGTAVAGFALEGDTAVVDLSGQVIHGAAALSDGPELELLALAALANTLTEFPAIDRVQVRVDGLPPNEENPQIAAFWGGWGLPEVLVRDESVVGPPREGEGVPDLSRFHDEEQAVGALESPPLQITSVRTRDRTTYLRVVVELTGLGDGEGTEIAPRAQASSEGGVVLLEIADVAAFDADVAPGQRIHLDDPGFASVDIHHADLPGQVRISVHPTTPRQFWLHTLASPTRVVLDVRK